MINCKQLSYKHFHLTYLRLAKVQCVLIPDTSAIIKVKPQHQHTQIGINFTYPAVNSTNTQTKNYRHPFRVRLLKTQFERMTDMKSSGSILVCLTGAPEQG